MTQTDRLVNVSECCELWQPKHSKCANRSLFDNNGKLNELRTQLYHLRSDDLLRMIRFIL